jgi:hypothetical protein
MDTVTGQLTEQERIRFEILASQALAVVNADWRKPTPEQVEYILDRAKSQARDAVIMEAV